MKAARQLVLYSKENFLNVALAVGYSSSVPLSRYYHAEFGLTPREDRDRANSFRVKGTVPLPLA
jgi:transcriptional regulator GlxA family with amidase domain